MTVERVSALPLTQGDIAGDYHTRVVVRQPSAEIFSGTLVVEWTNVTTGQDGEFVFGESHNTLLNQGYAVAVVSAEKTGVDNLVATRPEWYAGLEVEPEESAAGTCLPNKKGSVSVVWCIDEALQNEEFPGHVNETCTSEELSTLTINVGR